MIENPLRGRRLFLCEGLASVSVTSVLLMYVLDRHVPCGTCVSHVTCDLSGDYKHADTALKSSLPCWVASGMPRC